MDRILAGLLLALIGGCALYVFYKGVIVGLLGPYFKAGQQ